jgi:neutral trehalase
VWRERSQAMTGAIHAQLWNPAKQFYCDRDMAGNFIPVRAVSGFMPLLLDDVPPAHVDALERALLDPTAFAAACPIPSIALDEPTWSTDMWRGASWINMNTMTILGLARHGRGETARRLAEQTLAVVRAAYEQYGVLFEFYDASGQRPPMACDRKGPVSGVYDIRARYEVIRDYHWTAALCLALALSGGE